MTSCVLHLMGESLATRTARPVRLTVVADARDLTDVLAVARHGENLLFAGAGRGERDVPAVRRKGGALVGAFAECQLPRRVGRHVEHLDVVARTGVRGV